MYQKIKDLFNHPAYDVISGLAAVSVIVSASSTVFLDAYGQMHGHSPVKVDSNLAILGGLPIAHFFGRISRHFHAPLKPAMTYTAPVLEMPEIKIPVQTSDGPFTAV